MEPKEKNETTPHPIGRKNPLLAAFLSVFPGMGHIYNGLYLRGVTFFLLIAAAIQLAENGPEVFGFVVAFLWIFNVLDAYRQATLINYGYATDLGILEEPRRPRPGQGTLLAGIALVLIGLVSLVDVYFRIDLEWLYDLWPVGLMLVGGWLIWSAVREKRRAGEEEPLSQSTP